MRHLKKNLTCSCQGHLAFQGSHETLVFLMQHCVLSYLYSVSDAECPFVELHFVGDDSVTSALGMLRWVSISYDFKYISFAL